MKSLYEELGGTYRQVGDYLIPDIELPERNYEIGKYGRMRHPAANIRNSRCVIPAHRKRTSVRIWSMSMWGYS